MSSEAVVNEVKRLLAIAEEDATQWVDARDGMPFPEFDEATRADKVWQAGLSEGKLIGRVNTLKEILKNFS